MKKVGKTTIPFWYELNQIPYDYTLEVRNRFRGLDLIESLINYGQRFVTLYRRQGSRPSLKVGSSSAAQKDQLTGIGSTDHRGLQEHPGAGGEPSPTAASRAGPVPDCENGTGGAEESHHGFYCAEART